MSDPDVDCVIPTHGRPQYLREALDSVAAQTRPPVRVTVVSDDDDDESRAVVREFAERAGRMGVALVRRAHGSPGASASRNVGAAAGGSPLLAFLDDDDVWSPVYLERAVTRMTAAGADATVTSTQKFSAGGPSTRKVPRPDLDARAVFRSNPGVTGSNIVITRRAFDDLGGFDPELAVQNDRDFFLRFLLAGMAYTVEAEALVGVRQHAGGRLTDGTARRADGILLFDAKHGPAFGWWDRRTIRYASHYTRMSAASSRTAFARSAAGALANWSPTAARDLPLGLLRVDRVRKVLREMVTGSW